MSTTQTINLSFTVDGSVFEASRMMDDLVAQIKAFRNTRDLKATQTRLIEQWWTNPLPTEDSLHLAPHHLERQTAVPPSPEEMEQSAAPTEEQLEAARRAFPACEEDPQTYLNQSLFETGDFRLLDEDKQITGTGNYISRLGTPPAVHSAIRYKRCLLVRTPKQGDVVYCDAPSPQPIPLGYWNETLKGYVVKPEPNNVKEVCKWLDTLNFY